MNKATMIGCDLHDNSMVLKVAVDAGKPMHKFFPRSDVEEMIAWLKDLAAREQTPRIVFAYEASGLGFGLYDVLTDAGIECYVLAPTHLPHSVHQKKNKTDQKDALLVLDEVRAHVLAGRKLPAVWVPDPETRDDREPVRMRLQVGVERTRAKNQIRTLAKRSGLTFPAWFTRGGDWSRKSVQWLRDVSCGEVEGLGEGARTVLEHWLGIYEELCKRLKQLDQAIARLSKKKRYAKAFRKLLLLTGVGQLTAMTFLTEIGDLGRFANRRQLGAYLGLTPSAHESGERQDRKGRITRQGPSRVRYVLCQAAWAAIRCSDEWRATYERIRRGSKTRNKTALVAVMRQLGIQMWHAAKSPEADYWLEFIDDQKTSAQAQQKGPAPSVPAIASA